MKERLVWLHWEWGSRVLWVWSLPWLLPHRPPPSCIFEPRAPQNVEHPEKHWPHTASEFTRGHWGWRMNRAAKVMVPVLLGRSATSHRLQSTCSLSSTGSEHLNYFDQECKAMDWNNPLRASRAFQGFLFFLWSQYFGFCKQKYSGTGDLVWLTQLYWL